MKDLTGNKYGKVTVVKFLRKERVHYAKCGRTNYWYKVKCDCSKEWEKELRCIKKSKSCFNCRNIKHGGAVRGEGGTRTPEYMIWRGIMTRCYNKKSLQYKDYGGKGVKVCEIWHDYNNFSRDMSPRPKGLQIDRINPYGDYAPSNCRWVTPKDNSRNRRSHNKHLKPMKNYESIYTSIFSNIPYGVHAKYLGD